MINEVEIEQTDEENPYEILLADQSATKCPGCRDKNNLACIFTTPFMREQKYARMDGSTIITTEGQPILGLAMDRRTEWHTGDFCATIMRLHDYVVMHPEFSIRRGSQTISTIPLFNTEADHNVFIEDMVDFEIVEKLYDYEIYMGGTGQIPPSVLISAWENQAIAGRRMPFLGAFLPTNVPEVYPVTDMLMNLAITYRKKMDRLGLR